MNYAERQLKLLTLLKSHSLDALLVRKKENIFYLTGARGDDAILLVSDRGAFLISDSRYKEEYEKSAKNCKFQIAKHKSFYSCIEGICAKKRLQRIGFESNNFSYSEHVSLKKRLKGKKLLPVKKIVESLRIIKDTEEIKHIRRACKDGCETMNYALGIMRPGLSERWIKNRIECYVLEKGLEGTSFETIVASGKNASMPHARTSEKNIRKGEGVILDLGTINQRYNSDLTRTVFLGRIDRKYRRIYNIVRDAQKKAIEHIKPGIEASYIDNISRQYISHKGLGRYFIHSLGHGIGLETHEDPSISRNSCNMLQKNMVITIEPGIYIPGWGGIRIEDVALVTKDSCDILTSACRKVLCR
ncbi:MAG: aminopeptidase P family protein [Candidatus Omnitrophica bacterium]|nr:aminopeptidase P family protein [Candidatus Omnitrophota bacterium]